MVFNEKKVWSWSLLVSLGVNIALIAVASIFWLSFRIPREEEKPIVVELMELPAKEAPQALSPEAEFPRAELKPPENVRSEESLRPQVQSELAAKVQQERQQVRIPKPPVDLPQAESVFERAAPSGERVFTPGEELQVEERMQWEGPEAETTLRGMLERTGPSNLLASLAEQGLATSEGMVGETLATGELVPPAGTFERRSPYVRRPFAFAIENTPQARPQYGLSRASVVYEMLTEGGITRFLAVFEPQSAGRVGPVRSARPYFVLKAFEHDAILVHSGGSVEAYTYLRELAVDHIDEQKNFRPFERVRDRRPPHNLYALFPGLLEEVQRLGLGRPARAATFALLAPGEDLEGQEATKLEIRYDRNYRVQFTYDPERQVYLRSVNGEPHRDGESGVQIACGTIIVQVAEHKVKDAEGRVEIRFVGRGSGWMFLRGKAVPIVWEKKNFREKTRYYLQDGREARIASFPVWVEVIDSQEKVVF
ncbi:DUF3048 domain-containing protein [Candidatus Caldatribacterium saccharofermentans]|uniref:DUF3048 domain-containing protein n=1 Tax=Candidatus Caldatribacterium saccharofermentans TaxID=1454753 RepID=A0A7V4TFI9_9BACT